VDPRGLATFAVAGLVALFVSTAVGVDAAVLVFGGLASVVLNPIWWIGVGRALWSASYEAVSA
jgi:hypothetical protein